MTQQEIQTYNQNLVNKGEYITIIEYVKKLNDKFYNIDIPFIDDFMDFVDKEECCIEHILLQKYDIYKFTAGSNDVKKCLNKTKLKMMLIIGSDSNLTVQFMSYSRHF